MYDRLEAFLSDNRWGPRDIPNAVKAYLQCSRENRETASAGVRGDVDRLATAVPSVPKPIWEDFLLGIAEIQTYHAQERKLSVEAEARNERASREAIQETTAIIETLAQTGELDPKLQGVVSAFQTALGGNDLEKIHEAASEIWTSCRLKQELLRDHSCADLAKIGEKLRETHMDNFARAEKESEQFGEVLGKQKEALFTRYHTAASQLMTAHSEIRTSLLEHTRHRKQELFSSLPEIHFHSWPELAEDPTMFPFTVPGSPVEHQLALRTLHNLDLRAAIEERFHVDLGRIPLRSQLHLFQFLADRDRTGAIRFENLARQQGEDSSDFATSFLAASEGKEGGDLILGDAEQLPADMATRVFKHYANIVRNIDTGRDELQRIFGVDPDDGALRETIQALISRSNAFLKQVMRNPNSTQVLARLERASADSELFTAAFRTLKEGRDIPFETIKDVTFEKESGIEFGADTAAVEKAKLLFSEAYAQESEVFRSAVVHSFLAATKRADTHFYVLRYKGEPASLLRFDEIHAENGELAKLYFGSFISDAALGNGKLGEALFEESLRLETARGVPIEADCNPLSPITQKYIEAGFVAVAVADYAGLQSFSIRLDERLNAQSVTKKWTPEEVVRAGLEKPPGDTIQVMSGQDPQANALNIIDQAYDLPRYFKQGNRVYAVFERLSSAG